MCLAIFFCRVSEIIGFVAQYLVCRVERVYIGCEQMFHLSCFIGYQKISGLSHNILYVLSKEYV